MSENNEVYTRTITHFDIFNYRRFMYSGYIYDRGKLWIDIVLFCTIDPYFENSICALLQN